MKSPVLFVCCLLLNGITSRAADSSQQLSDIVQLVQKKQYQEAIAGYEQYLRQAPNSLQGAVQFEIATLHALLGNKDRALAMMGEAIESGFDDCLAVQQQAWKPIRIEPRFEALTSRVRVSEGDLKELHWLHSEIQNVHHDTMMMISENINRADNGITVIPQSIIPPRKTTSPGVLFYRELLKSMHQSQRQYVLQADKLRMRHLTNMTIISGGASSERVIRSSQFAERMAQERKSAVAGRQFIPPAETVATPRSCSEWK